MAAPLDENGANAVGKSEILLLKSIADQDFNPSKLKSALKYAKRLHRLCPDLDGVAKMLTSLRIISVAAVEATAETPNWYKILEVKPFSHINAIRKTYQKLALTLDHDKMAFKLVNGAFLVLADQIRRKEYDMELRMAMQIADEEAVEEIECGGGREGGDSDSGVTVVEDTFWAACSTCTLLRQFGRKHLGNDLRCPSCKKSFKTVEDPGEKKREISRILETDDRTVKDLGDKKRKISKILETDYRTVEDLGYKKREISKILETDDPTVEDPGYKKREISKILERDDRTVEDPGYKKRKISKIWETDDRKREIEKQKGEGFGWNSISVDRWNGIKVYGRLRGKRSGVSEMGILGKWKANESRISGGRNGRKGEQRRVDEMDILGKRLANVRRISGGRNEMKGQRRRVAEMGILGEWKANESRISADWNGKSLDLEMMAVEDSDFYDFDKGRIESSFKKGQVWAIYDNDGGMPRDYGLIHEVVSENPFEVSMKWLELESSGNGGGFRSSCGRFKVSEKTFVRSLNVFSHVVDCERDLGQIYRIYPKRGSVWAIYDQDSSNYGEGGKEKRGFDVVVLTSYNEIHGLSMWYLEKVDGFKAIFKRRDQNGCHAFRWIQRHDVWLFSHQIPARRLSGEEFPDISGACWELDPASLTPELLAVHWQK